MPERQNHRPAIGAIEFYFPSGMRSIEVPAYGDLFIAALFVRDIWEENDARLRVRLIKFLPDGVQMDICDLPSLGRGDLLMRLQHPHRPAIGAIEIYYPTGMRSIAIPLGTEMLLAAMEAHEIWEESDQQLRVDVVRFHADGTRECVLPLLPNGEVWSE